MEERKDIFAYIGQVLNIFAFTMITMMFFCRAFGELAKDISSMFSLGNKGLPLDIMLQFLLLSVIIVGLRFIFLTTCLIKRMPIILRTIFMMLMVSLSIICFIICFQWFPVNQWQAWAMFFLCFIVCIAASTIIFTIKTRFENRKMEEGLERLKKQWMEEKDGE